MASFIIYCRSADNLYRMLDDLIDKTPPDVIEEIILCNDNELDIEQYPKVTILKTDKIGRSKAWNLAGTHANSEHLVFLTQPTKFSTDWFPPLLKALTPQRLVSPTAFSLDTNLWASEPTGWRRYGMRWNFTVYDRKFGTRSPLAAFCLLIHRKFWLDLGEFDEGADNGPGENICLSLKTWMAGGEIAVVDDSYISVVPEVESSSRRNLARMVEAWFPRYARYFYDACGIEPTDVGRCAVLAKSATNAVRSIDWWLENLQPELLGVYRLRNIAHGKSIAIVGTGPSLDYINPTLINTHDVIIGVDYTGLVCECDYIVTDSTDVVVELRKKYAEHRFVVPYIMRHHAGGEFVMASDIMPTATPFEIGEIGTVGSVCPPFANFDNNLHLAVHFALFLGPSRVSLFGCDNKLIDGKSHTSKVEFYNDGKIWSDSDLTRKRFTFYEVGLNQLGQLALRLGIPLVRIGHV